MPGDYTRVSFDPRNDYSGVLLQQGRVTLDADVNEQVDVLDRRLRAEVVDTLARGVISRETPDAFLLTFAGGDLQIAPGRALVHGLLAENHGTDPLAYDPVLGEQRGTNPIPYQQQPYLPDPDPLPATGTGLAYLDVWQREVSCLEEHEIVEQAVAVDTTTRRQTAWQVRVVEAADGDDCASENAAYDEATAPSAGRLSTGAVGVPASTDPCTIAPFGGYRGLENRLYRVEIHDPGPLGTATFKWSRDNASLGATVLDIDTPRTEIRLSRLGRDGVQRISVGDWLEVTDDHRELHGEPGDLRQVVAVDEALAVVTFSTALTAGDFDATKPERHTRVVRWDQTGAAVDAAGGVLPVPAGGATPVALEDGIQVTFGAATAGGSFRVGDHWQFAARTADASVEELVDEPPAGVLHHHMKLGVVTFPGTVVDCRPSGAVEEVCGCGCDVCVTPESHASGALTIQAAVNQVRAVGGKICLTVGVYRLEEPVRIDRASSLHLEGRGWRTIILAGRAGPAFVVERSIGVTIDLLTVIAASVSRRGQTAIGTAIALRTTVATLIERCVLLQLGLLEREDPDAPEEPRDPRPEDPAEPEDPCPPDALKAFTGRVRRVSELRAPLGAKGTGGPLIAIDGLVLRTRIAENVLVGTTGIGALGADLGDPVTTDPETGRKPSRGDLTHVTPWGAADEERRERTSYLMTFDLVIEDNLLLCWLTGVSLEGYSAHQGETRIRGNQALVGVRAGIATTGLVGSGARIDIAGNIVRGIGTGIAFAGDDTRVVDNDVRLLTGVTSPRKEGSLTGLATTMSRDSGLLSESVSRVAGYLRLLGGDGIVAVPGIRPTGIDRALVRGNRVIEVLGEGISVQTHIVSGQISGNVIQDTGGMGIRMTKESSANELLMEGNQVLRVNRLVPDERVTLAAGIVVLNTYDVAVHGNQVRRVGPSEVVLGRVGIMVTGSTVVRVGTNSVHDVGIDELPGSSIAVGVMVGGAFARADIHDNTVRRGPRMLHLQETPGSWTGISALGSLLGDDPADIPSHEVLEEADPNTYVAGKEDVYAINAESGRIAVIAERRGSVGVRGNVTDGYGRAFGITVIAGPCVVGENRVTVSGRGEERFAALRVKADSAAVTANHVRARREQPSISVDAGPVTVLGNIATSRIVLNGGTLPAPWAALNS